MRKSPEFFISSSLLIITFLLCGCLSREVGLSPDPAKITDSVTLKFSYREDGRRQTGKMIMQREAERTKVVFFNQLNQAVLTMFSEGEETILLKPRSRIYWSGEFEDLISEMWGLRFTLREINELILKGEIPHEKCRRQGVALTVTNATGTRHPRVINLESKDQRLFFKIRRRSSKTGGLKWNDGRTGMTKVSLRELLDDG